MRAVVVYESMFGNTHLIARRIAEGFGRAGTAEVVPVGGAAAALAAGADLLVVGGPTHVHGMAGARSRAAAREQAEADPALHAMPDVEGPGLRDWFQGLELPAGLAAAAFDTRVHGPAILTGRASRGIARRLREAGARLVTPPESFTVSRDNHIADGEEARAAAWGRDLAVALEVAVHGAPRWASLTD